MQAERFRPLFDAKGPYASVYFDDSHDTEDADAQQHLKWRAVRTELEQLGAPADVVDVMEDAVLGAPPAVGRSGRGLVAGQDGVLVDEHLIRPIENPVIRYADLPYVVPIVEHGAWHATYVVATVDHAGGDVVLHRRGKVVTEEVDGGGYPVHKADSAETPGYGDPQRRTMEAGRKNLRAVAARLAQLVDTVAPDIVFVVGEVQSRADLGPTLEERVAALVVELDVGARDSGIDEAEVDHAIEQELLKRRLAAIDAAAQQFSQAMGQGSGLAVEGTGPVCEALRAGAVETLLVGDIGDRIVVADDDLLTVAPDADVLSELGAAPTHTLRADEALPGAAIMTGAAILRIDERLAPQDGIAAVLRFALP
jgi:peptide chain release factor subunit 1